MPLRRNLMSAYTREEPTMIAIPKMTDYDFGLQCSTELEST